MAELLLVANPHKRKKGHKARKHNPRRKSRRHNPHHGRRRRRHNPSFGNLQHQVMPVLKASFVGAGGALVNDVLYGFASPYVNNFLGAAAQGGFVQYGIKMASALATGWLARFAKLPGRELAEGAAIVATHDFLKAQLQSMAPALFGSGGTLALSGYSGMGAYLSGSAPVVGTATFPATNLPMGAGAGFGAYLSGSSGAVDGSGVYSDDSMGYQYWDGNQ